MRTTLTLDDDLAARLKERSRRSGVSFKQVVNDAIRRGLLAPDRISDQRPAFRVRTFRSGFVAGVDPERLNQLVDDLAIRGFGGGG